MSPLCMKFNGEIGMRSLKFNLLMTVACTLTFASCSSSKNLANVNTSDSYRQPASKQVLEFILNKDISMNEMHGTDVTADGDVEEPLIGQSSGWRSNINGVVCDIFLRTGPRHHKIKAGQIIQLISTKKIERGGGFAVVNFDDAFVPSLGWKKAFSQLYYNLRMPGLQGYIGEDTHGDITCKGSRFQKYDAQVFIDAFSSFATVKK